MHIDKSLNLVIPLERDDGTSLYVYSTPVARSVFKRYYMIFAKTFGAMYSGGSGTLRVAAMVMKDVAQEMGVWDGPEGAERGLIGEMRRLTNIIALTETGWSPIPIHEAIAKGLIDEEETEAVDNAIAFFTVASHMHTKPERKTVMAGVMGIWNARLESSGYTEFCASLPTSINAGISSPEAAIRPGPSIPM